MDESTEAFTSALGEVFDSSLPRHRRSRKLWDMAIKFERERLAKLAEKEYTAIQLATRRNKTGAKWMPALTAEEILAGKLGGGE